MKDRKKIGLALGSGAGRGYAHIGILQVFKENDIPVDVVTGSSVGAIIGGLYATGSDMHFLEKFAKVFEIKNMVDLSLLKNGLVKGDKVQNLIAMLTKHRKIEETDIPFACVAVDIETGKLETFTEGYIHEAVRASISIPGIFMPYQYNGRWYIDGGVIERVPVQAARDLGADIVIGVDVAYRGQKNKIPNTMTGVISTTLDICQWDSVKSKGDSSDLLLIPDVYGHSPNFDKDTLNCIEKGRAVALENLDRIKALIQS